MRPFQLTDEDLARHRASAAACKTMALDPARAAPLFIAYVPVPGLPSHREQVESPARMFEAELARLQAHLDVGDDYLPTLRVQFGTGQVAAAFGCPIHVLEDSLPACGGPALRGTAEVYGLRKPALTAGWYGKLRDFTDYFLERLPAGAVIQHPDIQSPFNTAHLVRGDGIFTDFYDAPEAVGHLLDLVTDYLVELVPWLKRPISQDAEWFFDSGMLWKGAARISNCSMQMISPEFYEAHVLPRDARLMRAIGGGRGHYCGIVDQVIYKYFQLPAVTGLDYDGRHDLWALSAAAPPALVLMHPVEQDSAVYRRLAAGDWPAKRNLVLVGWVKSLDEGRRWLRELRDGWARRGAGGSGG
jgi:hypothetical protein